MAVFHISLRWHYPNQVVGPGHTSRSQPACTSSPFVYDTVYPFVSIYASGNLYFAKKRINLLDIYHGGSPESTCDFSRRGKQKPERIHIHRQVSLLQQDAADEHQDSQNDEQPTLKNSAYTVPNAGIIPITRNTAIRMLNTLLRKPFIIAPPYFYNILFYYITAEGGFH